MYHFQLKWLLIMRCMMANIKDVLVKKVNNYKLGDIKSVDAERLRSGMLSFIQNNTMETIDEVLDIYCQDFYELMEFDNFEDMTTTTSIMKYFEDVRPHLGDSADAIYATETSLFLKKYEQEEPLFVAIVDTVYNIVNTDNVDASDHSFLIGDICFFIESLLAAIEEADE